MTRQLRSPLLDPLLTKNPVYRNRLSGLQVFFDNGHCLIAYAEFKDRTRGLSRPEVGGLIRQFRLTQIILAGTRYLLVGDKLPSKARLGAEILQALTHEPLLFGVEP